MLARSEHGGTWLSVVVVTATVIAVCYDSRTSV